MAQADLVSLSDVKAWLSIQNTDTSRDAILQRLITQISLAVYNWCNRDFFLPRNVTELYDGNGRAHLQLINWPVSQIISLYVSGVMIPQRVPNGLSPASIASTGPVPTVSVPAYHVAGGYSSGYVLDSGSIDPPGNMQLIHLSGYMFTKGRQNVAVQYQAGYTVFGEQQTVPSSPYTLTAYAPYGSWGLDWSVAYADTGLYLTAVSGTPSAGQYSVSGGVYTFSSADAGRSVLLSYGYVPADVSQCVLEWVQLRWVERDRPGQSSKSLGGQETVAFKNEDMPKFIALTLNNFRRVTTQ